MEYKATPVPGSPVKHLLMNNEQVPMQPRGSSSKNPSSVIARPRPTPRNQFCPLIKPIKRASLIQPLPVVAQTLFPMVQLMKTISLSYISPALLSPTKTNQGPNTQGLLTLLQTAICLVVQLMIVVHVKLVLTSLIIRLGLHHWRQT